MNPIWFELFETAHQGYLQAIELFWKITMIHMRCIEEQL